MSICPWCSNSLLTSRETERGACAVCRPQMTTADFVRLPHAQPVEGPMGDPEAGGSPPAGAEPVDQKAPTVPAPPPTVDMEDES